MSAALRRLAVVWPIALVLSGCGCGSGPADGPAHGREGESPAAVRPADEAEVAAPARVAVLGGPVAEVVAALGQAERVVVVDGSVPAAPQWAAATRVDYFRRFAAEPVLAAEPELALVADGAGPPAALEDLRAAGVRLELLPEVHDLAGATARIEQIARALGVPERGADIVAKLRADHAAALGLVPAPGATRPPRALFLYARGAGTLLVAGTDSPVAGLLRQVGAEPVGHGGREFRPLTAESVAGLDPEVLIVTQGGLGSVGGAAGLATLPGLATTSALRHQRIVAVDDLALLGFGPSMPDALRALVEGLHGVGAGGGGAGGGGA